MCHKTNINTFQRMEIIKSVFSDHNGTELEINNRGRTEKSPNWW